MFQVIYSENELANETDMWWAVREKKRLYEHTP